MGVTLTKQEKRFLREMLKMERLCVEFGHQRIASRLGYTSLGTTWDFLKALERKGYLEKGRRLAEVKCPVVTKAGRELLGAKRAA